MASKTTATRVPNLLICALGSDVFSRQKSLSFFAINFYAGHPYGFS